MRKRVSTQTQRSGASNLGEVGAGQKLKTQRKATKTSAQTSPRPARVFSQPDAAPGDQPVRFELFDPQARQAFLVGTFNDWQPDVTPLKNLGDGNWTVELRLKPGTYEYRFVVNGRWIEDPKSLQFATNPFGGVNSVVEVRER